jgi:uncharacterized repeat protein (TIGR01451 family)
LNGSVTLQANAVTVDPCSFISAKGTGFPGEQGPGVGGFYNGHGTGGGYGGRGGSRNDTGGVTYGSSLFPTDMGSGGGNTNASIVHSGSGGGAIRLDVANLTVNGAITADGNDGVYYSTLQLYGGGGSGGSIYINVQNLAGAGLIRANGGYGRFGGGGGGRVAVYYESSQFNGSILAQGGTGLSQADYGQAGSVVMQEPSLENSPATAMQASAGFESQDALSETIRSMTANLSGVQVSGDFNSVMNFSSFEVVTIESGSFAGQGFAKANWQVNLDGVDYAGSWRAVVTRTQNQSASAVYMKGVISGDISGVTEDSFIESAEDANVIGAYNSTWTLSRLKNNIATSSITLSGVLSSQQTTDYPSTSLYLVQGSFDATSYGHYTGPLGVILTHIRINTQSNPYDGEGFTTISYTSDAGQGLASCYTTLESPAMTALRGNCGNPLPGILTGTLDESANPKRLTVSIERVDMGLPPDAILSVKLWAPSSVTPGDAVRYMLEYRNDGTRPAQNVRIAHKLPKGVEIISHTGSATYRANGALDDTPEVVWTVDSIPPKSKGQLSTYVRVKWGLSQQERLRTFATVDSYNRLYEPNTAVESTVAEQNDNFIRINDVFIDNNVPSSTIDTTCLIEDDGIEINEPNLTITTANDVDFSVSMTFRANPFYYIHTNLYGGRPRSFESLVDRYMNHPKYGKDIIYFGAGLNEKRFVEWLYANDYIDSTMQDYFLEEAGIQAIVKWNADAAIRALDKTGYLKLISEGLVDALTGLPSKELGEAIAAYEAQKAEPRVPTDLPENALSGVMEKYVIADNEAPDVPQTPAKPQRPSWWSESFKENIEHKLWLPWHKADVAFMTIKNVWSCIVQFVLAALDPNKLYGPEGRVLPGEQLNYRVEFENIGQGAAYGVYFTDTLDEDVNDATLQIGPVLDVDTNSVLAGPGVYNPATRTITWFVGRVEPNQGGYANLSINVNTEAQHGAEIINYATIYFPSVPQALRTNGIVSTVLLNQPPTANAGPDQSVHIGDTVILDGGASTDPDADLLTFRWAFALKPAGSQAVLTEPNSLNPSFVPDLHGTYTVALVVSDGNDESPIDIVKISTVNVAPVADAGDDQTVQIGDIVTLDASGSTDSDGDLLSFNWAFESVPAGSSAALDDANSVSPVFVADVGGDYVVRLIVNDGRADSAPDTVVISTVNLVPIANAGEDQAVHIGDLVTLDASASSDPDGDELTYLWVFTVLPEGSVADLNDANSVHPTLTADVPGSYVLSLVVNDGVQDSAPDTVTISTINVAPIAAAGEDQAVYVGSIVDLNGTGSWDPDGDSLYFNWSFTTLPAGSSAVLDNTETPTPSFTADAPGTYVVSLTVSDGWLTSTPDTVTISTINTVPTADAGGDQSVVAGSVVTLDGSASSDPDGDVLTYSWAFTSKPQGSAAILTNPNSQNPSFTADLPGIYVLTLVVSDGISDSAPDSVTVSAISQQTWATDIVQQIIQNINAMDRHDFRNRHNKRVLTGKLNAVIFKIEREHYLSAIRTLENDVLRKTDGCAEHGHVDFTDWIIKCDAQASVYPLLIEVIDILETMPRACCSGCPYGFHRPGCRAWQH